MNRKPDLMRNLLSVFFILVASSFSTCCFAQSNFENQWKLIDSLINKKGLPVSALAEVDKIYTLAKKQNNQAQVIKALIYKMGLLSREENSTEKSIHSLEKEISTSSEPARSILQSILAETYWTYFQNNRWKLYDRTETINFIKKDIQTWNASDFIKTSRELYLSGIRNEKLLQQVDLSKFEPIIIAGNARHLRPTLYDLLAHRALDHFKATINEAADDSLTNKAIHKLFNDLISFHEKDGNIAALIDVKIEQIEFDHITSTDENTDSTYIKKLHELITKFPNEKETRHAWLLLAEMHAQKARTYDPLKNTANRFAYIDAKNILETLVAFNDSFFTTFIARQLLNEITNKEIHLEVEKVNVPGQPFRMLVTYKNVTNLNFRLIKYDEKVRSEIRTGNDADSFWKSILALPSIRTFSQSLPATNDYQSHRVEIKIDQLPVGEFALVVSTKDFTITNGEPLALQQLQISNISYIHHADDFFVLNRTTGQPLAGASVIATKRVYNSRSKTYEQKSSSYKTDKYGHFQLKRDSSFPEAYTKIDITTSDDFLHSLEEVFTYYRQYEAVNEGKGGAEDFEKNNQNIFYFTDRSIYRPGQTVFFKGIVIAKDAKTKLSKVIPNFTTTVYLENANDEEVDSIEVKSNEFGSFSGKFKLPENILTGEFSIYDKNTDAEITFSVEEYKRPKFLTEFEPQKGTYKLYDSIIITGTAKAFAGNNIEGAKVKYTVTRKARFPYSWLLWQRGWINSREEQIAFGEVTTDANGKFSFRFNAIPDKTISKEFEPVFDFAVEVEVADISGETRNAETTVSVGYKSLVLSVKIPRNTMDADSLKYIFIKTTNQAGEFQPSKFTMSIWKLDAPKRLIRSRLWPEPDQFVMSKSEYISYFPHDEYSNETKKETWQRLEKVFEKADSSVANEIISINNHNFSAGWYLIEVITHDKDGNEVKDIKYVQLTGKSFTTNEYNLYPGSQFLSAQPGSTANPIVGSSAENVFVIKVVDKDSSRDNFEYINVNNESKTLPVLVREVDRGGFGVFFAFVKDNRFYKTNYNIMVPFTDKELTITYETFRDKTLPGSEEKWKVKITGYKNEKVAAELLTTMYDASLDQFKEHNWSIPDLWPAYYQNDYWDDARNFITQESIERYFYQDIFSTNRIYDQLLDMEERRRMSIKRTSPLLSLQGRVPGLNMEMEDLAYVKVSDFNKRKESADSSYLNDEKAPLANSTKKENEIYIRKNFNETAFFFPDLRTDPDGNIEFSFTMPEALTKWKLLLLAHTKDLSFAQSEKNIITQKDLMLQPNLPRYFKEGDNMEIAVKVVNMSDKEVTGQVELQLLDATSNQPVDGWFQNIYPNQYFTAEASKSAVAHFSVQIPYHVNKPVIVRLFARSGNNSDGEENIIPVLTNQVLVTETLPITMKGTGSKDFVFSHLLESDKSETLIHHALTVEYTGNPAWYAVQALPYLMEFPYECSEQTWNRLYANALASKIVNSSPRIKEVFEKWKISDTAALLSSLQKNEELKSILLQETPWVMDAKSETEQKRRIALLFDMVKLSGELEKNLARLEQMQLASGGFMWFKGGNENRYITEYIVAGIGRLRQLNAIPASLKTGINRIVKNSISYLDAQLKKDYDLLKRSKSNLSIINPDALQIQYLYARSFFNDVPVSGSILPAYTYYRKQAQQSWLSQNKYLQGMIALSLFRTGDGKTSFDIIRSLKQNSISSPELGMYWKEMSGGYYWYQAPIETQSLLIEAFSIISKDQHSVDAMKTWLLKNKQTNNWHTTKATADACYALLLQGSNWLANSPSITIKLGDKIIAGSNNAEPGLGYLKKTIDGPFVNDQMGKISVTVSQSDKAKATTSNSSISWGAIYWQYFEDADNISSAGSPLQVTKKLFIVRNTSKGPVLEPVSDKASIKIGDKITVRIELRTDRNLEYVHMKDMRGATFEPVNVLSNYKWQGGLGYYEATKDASTNFFFDYIAKGTYVFEYSMFATQLGTFGNGITTVQCMYAPEFSSHSEGLRVNVE